MAENRYCDIEAFLDTIPQYAGESGVVRAGALLEELGHPEKTLKIIHVAGSNGKGDRKSTRLNSSHYQQSRMPSSA